MFPKILSILLILLLIEVSHADDCLDWFKSSGIKAKDKQCISKCNLYPKDMGTFSCSNECEKFCNDQKCPIDPFWKNKVKSGRPKNWAYDLEKTIDWEEGQREQMEKILSRLPEEFKKLVFDGIYRMKTSKDKINPGSTSEDGQYIVLYDRAFGHPHWTTADVLLHELGHVVYMSYSKKEQYQYRKELGWEKGHLRKGGFVSSNSKEDHFEDFAENFKYLILYPEDLNRINETVFKWFKKKYKKQLTLKEECV